MNTDKENGFRDARVVSDTLIDVNEKYVALNIKPMLSIGTFEFRALKGGITPDQFSEMLDIFHVLWDFKGESDSVNGLRSLIVA